MEPFSEREAADSGAHDQNLLLVIHDNETSLMKSNIKKNKNSLCCQLTLVISTLI